VIYPRKRRRTEWSEEEKAWLVNWGNRWRQGNPTVQLQFCIINTTITTTPLLLLLPQLFTTQLFTIYMYDFVDPVLLGQLFACHPERA